VTRGDGLRFAHTVSGGLPATNQDVRQQALKPSLRVASLLPSATEMVHFAGAVDALVGVTHECDYPAGVERHPRLTSSEIDGHGMTSAEIDAAVERHMTDSGSLYALDAKLLEELAPDLILTQGLCDVCAVSTSLVERAVEGLEKEPGILTLNPTSLGDVFDDAVRIGEALGRGDEARERISALEARLAGVERAVAGLCRPRVGCIEWLDPPFSAGHWVPEMVSIAGGEEVFAGAGERSARLSWEEVFEAAPEVLVLMPCGFDERRAAEEARHLLPELPGWGNLPAVRDGRVWVVDANSYFSRPAPRLVEGVEILAHVLHPGAFPDAPGGVRALGEEGAFSEGRS
jgi:iron complex transport system substrate-binding protein